MTESTRGFQFVTVRGGNSEHRSRTWVDAEERRKVRVTVMRDYIQQKSHPKARSTSQLPKGLTDMKSQMSRFRPVSAKAKGQTAVNRAAWEDTRRRSSRLPELRPYQDEAKHDDRLLRLPGLSGVDPFNIVPVDMSEPDTRDLMEYYFKSYWSNSLAVNPNGGWTLVALRDKAIIHAKLSLVAVHRADRLGEPLSPAYLKHRGLALRLIADRLAKEDDATSDLSIGAVTILSSSDYHSSWPDETLDQHAAGITALVLKRGGIDAPTMSKNVARVVAWVDLLHAALRNQAVTMGRSRHAQDIDVAELVNLTGNSHIAVSKRRGSTQFLPSLIRDIFNRLALLSNVKDFIRTNRIARLREMFSDMLWNVEYEILELSAEDRAETISSSDDNSMFDDTSMLTILRDSFIIYSYIAFRDQNSSALYKRLAGRLEQNLFELNGSFENLGLLSSNELDLLLWVLYTGWKGATLAHKATSWFTAQAGKIAAALVLADEASARVHLENLAWNEENDVNLFPAFWDEVKDAEARSFGSRSHDDSPW